MTAPASVEPGYSFEFDQKKNLMRITSRGFWSIETVHAFIAAGLEATQRAQRTHPAYDTLVDARDFPVQSTLVSGALTEAMRIGAETHPGRVAVVSRNQLGKMQGDRINPNPRLKIFLSEDAATAWLAEPHSKPEL